MQDSGLASNKTISLLFQDGYAHNWHFDESHWSTTLMLQQPEQGGEFQFTKPFRNEDNEEETYKVAESVLAGDKDHVNTLEFHPGILKIQVDLEKKLIFNIGTLSIFQGRRSLHSVTKCSGAKNRLLGVLHFSQR